MKVLHKIVLWGLKLGFKLFICHLINFINWSKHRSKRSKHRSKRSKWSKRSKRSNLFTPLTPFTPRDPPPVFYFCQSIKSTQDISKCSLHIIETLDSRVSNFPSIWWTRLITSLNTFSILSTFWVSCFASLSKELSSFSGIGSFSTLRLAKMPVKALIMK